jgi:trafficking protein particle complex subunit 13
MSAKAPFNATSLNWDAYGKGRAQEHAPVLNPRDIIQVAFLLEKDNSPVSSNVVVSGEEPPLATGGDKKLILGQLYIQWRSAMGDRGFLSTGWLTGRKRS